MRFGCGFESDDRLGLKNLKAWRYLHLRHAFPWNPSLMFHFSLVEPLSWEMLCLVSSSYDPCRETSDNLSFHTGSKIQNHPLFVWLQPSEQRGFLGGVVKFCHLVSSRFQSTSRASSTWTSFWSLLPWIERYRDFAGLINQSPQLSQHLRYLRIWSRPIH